MTSKHLTLIGRPPRSFEALHNTVARSPIWRANPIKKLISLLVAVVINSTVTASVSFVRSEFADLGEVRIHYLTAGNGPVIVLLHGWPETSHEWKAVAQDLAQDHLVIAPDLRGLGESSRPATGYDKKTVANDIDLLLKKLQIKSAFVVGHDWGSVVAYSLAQEHPERVSKLAMLDVGVLDESFYTIPMVVVRDRIWHMPFHNVKDLPELLVQGKEREYISWFFATAHNKNAFSSTDIDEYTREYSKPGAMHAGFEYYRAMDVDIADQKARAGKKLTIPVLALGGEFSWGDRVAQSLKGIADNVTGGVIQGSGHWIPEEQPEALVRELRAFDSK